MPHKQVWRHTLLEEGIARCGSFRTTMSALTYLVEWGRATDALGHPVTVEEYAEHVSVSLSQAYRRQAAFRVCFPDVELHARWLGVRPFLDEHSMQVRAPIVQATYMATLAEPES